MDKLFETGEDSKLSSDLMTEIMKWIPANIGQRWKFVNRNWYYSLRNRKFIEAQEEKFSRQPKQIIVHCERPGNATHRHAFHILEDLDPPHENLIIRTKYIPIPLADRTEVHLIGSSHGIVLITVKKLNERAVAVIWNPVTGIGAALPEPDNGGPILNPVYGIGYSQQHEDVAAVKSYSVMVDNRTLRYWSVYLLGKGLWLPPIKKEGEAVTTLLPDSVCDGDSISWIGNDGSQSRWIVFFSLSDSEVKEVPIPTDAILEHMSLVVSSGKLKLISSDAVSPIGQKFKVWDAGHRFNWISECSIGHIGDKHSRVRPLFVRNNQILVGKDKWNPNRGPNCYEGQLEFRNFDNESTYCYKTTLHKSSISWKKAVAYSPTLRTVNPPANVQREHN